MFATVSLYDLNVQMHDALFINLVKNFVKTKCYLFPEVSGIIKTDKNENGRGKLLFMEDRHKYYTPEKLRMPKIYQISVLDL